MILAIGIYIDESWSISIDSQDPKMIAQELYAVGSGHDPDQILLVKNDHVFQHYNLGKDY